MYFTTSSQQGGGEGEDSDLARVRQAAPRVFQQCLVGGGDKEKGRSPPVETAFDS